MSRTTAPYERAIYWRKGRRGWCARQAVNEVVKEHEAKFKAFGAEMDVLVGNLEAELEKKNAALKDVRAPGGSKRPPQRPADPNVHLSVGIGGAF